MDLAAERLIILRCAEIVGAAAFCFETGVQYLKDRRQFGQPIGANQALKHLAADGYVQLENIRVAVTYAAASMDRALSNPGKAASLEDAREAVCVVLSYVPETARELAELSIQFHGGIGVTWEYTLNRYLRRIIRLGQSLGSSGYHRRALFSRVAGEAAVVPSNSNTDIVRQTTP
jgi:alkylation response protein AidB-like acyl-CoA dehydrogenase